MYSYAILDLVCNPIQLTEWCLMCVCLPCDIKYSYGMNQYYCDILTSLVKNTWSFCTLHRQLDL